MEEILKWLLKNKDIVGWIIAVSGAIVVIGAAYIQGRFALKAIRDQINYSINSEIRRESDLKSSLENCLYIDLSIVERQLDTLKILSEDYLRRSSYEIVAVPNINIVVPDTIGSHWSDLSRLDVETLKLTRKISADLSSLRELSFSEAMDESKKDHFSSELFSRIKITKSTIARLNDALAIEGDQGNSTES